MSAATPADVVVAPPVADLDSAFHWEGLRRHHLLLQGCSACGRVRYPAMPTCPYCASPGFEVREVEGRGEVYSWIVVHRAFSPEFQSQVPYTLATVTLDEGCRVVGRLEGAAPDFGLRVRASFFDHPAWTELRFRADN